MALLPAAGNAERPRNSLSDFVRHFILVASICFVVALLGSLTRPMGFLAVFWPANAVLAGMLIRHANLRAAGMVVAAAVGYFAAGIVVGDRLYDSVLMTSANLAGAIVLTQFFSALPDADRLLERPRGVAALAVYSAIASIVAGVLGGIVFSQLRNVSYFEGWWGWFSAEMVNYLALLPLLLTLPLLETWRLRRPRAADLRQCLPPVLLTVIAIAASPLLPNPLGVVAPLPALVWCALALPMPGSAALVLIYSGVAMLGIKLGIFDFGFHAPLDEGQIAIAHLGVALVALGPILVASASAERRRRLDQLERLTRLDSLTEALTRRAFEEAGQALVERLRRTGAPVAVLLCDADHFKAINDLHGHAAGDRALTALAAAIRAAIRQDDIVGRLGGEEFALVLADTTRREASVVAERIRQAVERLEIVLDSGDIYRLTVSVGVYFAHAASFDLAEMVSRADRAMYEAKRAGRNRVVVAEP
jgi:diguanylate cyclase (GGDEF)-like protein